MEIQYGLWDKGSFISQGKTPDDRRFYEKIYIHMQYYVKTWRLPFEDYRLAN